MNTNTTRRQALATMSLAMSGGMSMTAWNTAYADTVGKATLPAAASLLRALTLKLAKTPRHRQRHRRAGPPARRSHHGACRSALCIGNCPHPFHLEALTVTAKGTDCVADAGMRTQNPADQRPGVPMENLPGLRRNAPIGLATGLSRRVSEQTLP